MLDYILTIITKIIVGSFIAALVWASILAVAYIFGYILAFLFL